MGESSVYARAREYFLAARALRETEGLTESVRCAVAARLDAARRKRGAAEALLSAEYPIEALKLSAEALGSGFEALALASQDTDPQGAPEALSRWGIDARAAAEALSVWKELSEVSLPTTLDAVNQGHIELLDRALCACRVMERAFQWVSRDGYARVGVRVGRVLLALLAASLASLCASRVAHRWPLGSASASEVFGDNSEYNNMYRARYAFDRDPSTEWLLPDYKSGWVQVSLGAPREVREVLVLNAHNGRYNDRATREYSVELYAAERLLAGVHGTFGSLSPQPAWVPVAVGGHGVTRVRFVVKSYFGAGGGLAELDIR